MAPVCVSVIRYMEGDLPGTAFLRACHCNGYYEYKNG
jgi:hypothetical protein